MLSRRPVLAGLAAVLLPSPLRAALPVPPSRRLGFDVVRNGSRMGSHKLEFTADGDQLTVRIAVELAVSFGPIPLFRYRHHATERWQGDRFIELAAETDDNGKRHQVKVAREADGSFAITTGDAKHSAPPEALAATHWNRAMLGVPLINTQTGKVEHYQVEPLGRAEIPDAAGRDLAVDAYTLSADISFDTYYEITPTWAGLRFKGDDGSEIVYRRL